MLTRDIRVNTRCLYSALHPPGRIRKMPNESENCAICELLKRFEKFEQEQRNNTALIDRRLKYMETGDTSKKGVQSDGVSKDKKDTETGDPVMSFGRRIPVSYVSNGRVQPTPALLSGEEDTSESFAKSGWEEIRLDFEGIKDSLVKLRLPNHYRLNDSRYKLQR